MLSLFLSAFFLGLLFNAAPGAIFAESLRRGIKGGLFTSIRSADWFTSRRFHVGSPWPARCSGTLHAAQHRVTLGTRWRRVAALACMAKFSRCPFACA